MRFEQTVRGLSPGAAVDFMGVEVGTVRSIAPAHAAQAKTVGEAFPIEVVADLYPERFGTIRQALIQGHPGPHPDLHLLRRLVERGLRAQTRNASLIGEMRAIQFVSRLIAEGRLDETRYKNLRLHMVADDAYMATLGAQSKFDTDRAFLDTLFAHGRSAASQRVSSPLRSMFSPSQT
jgi:hypothetical protein